MLALALVLPIRVAAQGAITIVDNPGGGQYVYGPIQAGASERTVIVDMLGRIHRKFGESPRVGRVLRNKTGESLAAFWDTRTGAPGGGPVSGMIILSEPSGRPGTAAVLYDMSTRFATTAGQMLHRLNGVVGGSAAPSPATGSPAGSPVSTAPSAPAGSANGSAEPLQFNPFPDGTGSVGLPAGWHIVEAAHGGAIARGPRGEQVVLSRTFNAVDPRSPAGQQMIRTMGLPGSMVAIEYGSDPTQAYLSAVNQMAQKQHRQPPALNVTSAGQQKGPDGYPFTVLNGDVDLHDGEGVRDIMVHEYVMGQPDQLGNWGLVVFSFIVPKGEMPRYQATMNAIRYSFRQNGQAMQGQDQAALARQKAAFDASQALNQARNQAFDAHMKSLDQASADRAAAGDAQGKRNQAFDNYLLDRTAITDTRTGEQGTVSNAYAQSLMHYDSHFQEVPTEDLLKGVTW